MSQSCRALTMPRKLLTLLLTNTARCKREFSAIFYRKEKTFWVVLSV